MLVGILVPVVLITAGLVAFWVWYRRKIASMAPTDAPEPSSVRLTADRLRTLSSPPWRVVFEISSSRLGGMDHVIIGSSGAIAVRTVLGDRPAPAPVDEDPAAVARGALERASVDELASTVGARCRRTAIVYWGAPRPHEPPAHETVAGTWAVEGQRLTEWIVTLPPGSDPQARVDLTWQAITTGIGRPDPLG